MMFLWQGDKWRLKTTHTGKYLIILTRHTRLLPALPNILAEATCPFKLIEIAKY